MGLFQVVPGRIPLWNIVYSQLHIANDDAKDIIEVVGNPSGQGSYGFHFMRLSKLRFQLFAFGDIVENG